MKYRRSVLRRQLLHWITRTFPQCLVEQYQPTQATRKQALCTAKAWASPTLESSLLATISEITSRETWHLLLDAVESASFREEDPESLANALKILKESNLRYIFAIIHEKGFAQVLEQAFDAGLVGDEYTWYLSELDLILEPGFALNRKGQAKVAAESTR